MDLTPSFLAPNSAYLSDISAKINNLNTSMQGRDQTLVGLTEKLTVVEEENRRKENCFILILNLLLEDENTEFSDVQNVIVGCLAKLS
jgi:hypothetical protein